MMRRPPITITCECGETESVPYGERWECERCGRRWNTQQMPAEEYERLLRRIAHRIDQVEERIGWAGIVALLVGAVAVGVAVIYWKT